MTFSMFKSQAHYSLVIKDHVIRAVGLRKPSPDGVRNFFEESIPPGVIENGIISDKDALEILLKKCFKAWKLKGKKLFIVVPDTLSVVRKIDLPGHLDLNEIRAHLFMEIGQSIHLPFDNPIFDTHLICQSSEQTELLLFAIPESVVKSYVDLLEICHTKPVSAELSSLSLYRLYKKLDHAMDSSTMFVQFDLDGINVSIFKGELPLFIRQVKSENPDEGNESVETKYADTFAEIERIMNFYQFTINNGTDAVQKIVLAGDHPLIREFNNRMSEVMSIPVDPLFNYVIHDVSNKRVPREFQVNIGLALKEEAKK